MIHHLEYRAMCSEYSVRVCPELFNGHFLYEFSSFGRGFGIPTGSHGHRRSFQGLDEDGQQPYTLGPWRSDRGERPHFFSPPVFSIRRKHPWMFAHIQDISIMDICDYIYTAIYLSIYIYIYMRIDITCNTNSKHAHAQTHSVYTYMNHSS